MFFFVLFQGCKENLVLWLRSTADILFVIGYCVISFLKITFLGILRYELKEMIQKIKLLQAEIATAVLQGDCGINGSTDQSQVCLSETTLHNLIINYNFTQLIVNPLSVNGGFQFGEHKVGNRDKSFVEANEGERESLLLNENTTPKLLKHKQFYNCINEQNGGGDLDTSSNCALIVGDFSNNNPLATTSAGMKIRAAYSKEPSKQPQEPIRHQKVQQQPTMSSLTVEVGAIKKTINGNNNYELTDFDTKTPNYR